MVNLLFRRKSSGRKIGILYICTGKYNVFWNDFYKTSRRRFCLKSDLHYFVFTENAIDTLGDGGVHQIHQPRLGWPYDTLKRFHIFLDHRSAIEEMNYLYFFNANMVFRRRVTEEEILPDAGGSGLVSVMHPYFYDHNLLAPFEDNRASTAFVDANKRLDYFQGCLSGGRTREYLLMATEIKRLVDLDLEKGIIGKWWDESYMNRYFQAHPPRALSPAYAYPEGAKLPFQKKIVQLDKAKSGGHDFLRS